MAQLNIDNIVSEVRFDNRVSSKTGNPYNMLVVKLDNGYEWESFVDKPVEYMIKSLLGGLETDKK